MAFYSQGKEFLNLPEQVEKNTTDIDGLKTKDIADLKSKEAKNATDIANNTADLADLKNRTSAVEKNTTTPNGNITTGTLGVEKKATFGNDVEVAGGLTLKSPSDLHFKAGDTDYTDFNSFKDTYYATVGIAKYAGIVLPPFQNEWILPDIKKFTRLDLLFAGATICFASSTEGSFSMPDLGDNIIANHLFYESKAVNYINLSEIDWNITMGNGSTSGSYWIFALIKNVVRIDVADGKKFSLKGNGTQTFSSNPKLRDIGAFDVSGITNFSNAFIGDTALASIHCTHFKVSFDISVSTAFETDDLVEIIGNLDQVTTAQTLTMGSVNLAKLTQDQILVATGKGWTLA